VFLFDQVTLEHPCGKVAMPHTGILTVVTTTTAHPAKVVKTIADGVLQEAVSTQEDVYPFNRDHHLFQSGKDVMLATIT